MAQAADHHHHDHAHAHTRGHSPSHGHHGHSRGLRSGHHHHHAAPSFGARFAIGAGLNLAFVAAEAGFGFVSGSVALLADAGHNLGDVAALLAAWAAASLAGRKPSDRYTYGLGSTSMLAALFNAVALLLITGGVASEAIQRLLHPAPVGGATVMIVAAVGILVNGGTALLFAAGRAGDLNIRAAFQHQLADAMIAAGVVAAGALVFWTHQAWIDPLASLVVSALIVAGTWGLLRESLDMVLHAAPPGIEPAAVRRFLTERPGVTDLHDLHIWPMSTTETALTAHLVMPGGHPGDAALTLICEELRQHFAICHSTLQIELDADGACRLQPADVI